MFDQSYAAYEISRKLGSSFRHKLWIKRKFVVEVRKCASQHCFAAPLREKIDWGFVFANAAHGDLLIKLIKG